MNIDPGGLSFLQVIFPNYKSVLGLLHCRWIFYQLSYQGSPNFCYFFSNYFLPFCGQEEWRILVWGLLWHQRFIAVDPMGFVGFRQVSRTEASLQHQQYS